MKARLSTDGGARGNPGPAAYGYVLEADDGTVLDARGERIGVATNNVAEYRALIAGLEAARDFPARRVSVRADSMLVIRQVEGAWKVKQPHLRPLLEEARALLAGYEEVDLQHVRREQNTDADALVNAALDLPGDRV
jgi:ribonuclease HI